MGPPLEPHVGNIENGKRRGESPIDPSHVPTMAESALLTLVRLDPIKWTEPCSDLGAAQTTEPLAVAVAGPFRNEECDSPPAPPQRGGAASRPAS